MSSQYKRYCKCGVETNQSWHQRCQMCQLVWQQEKKCGKKMTRPGYKKKGRGRYRGRGGNHRASTRKILICQIMDKNLLYFKDPLHIKDLLPMVPLKKLSNVPLKKLSNVPLKKLANVPLPSLLILPPEVVIFKILPFVEITLKEYNAKDLYGYFGNDRRIYPIWKSINHISIKKLVLYPILTSLTIGDGYKCNINELTEYPLLTSLTIECGCEISELKEYPLLTSLKIRGYYDDYYWCGGKIRCGGKISELKEYPLLTSLTLACCFNISELKEYPLLTSLYIRGSKISKLKEYPLLTSLTLVNCIISELKEYPLLTSLKIIDSKITELKGYPLLTSLYISYPPPTFPTSQEIAYGDAGPSYKIPEYRKISELKEYPLLTSLYISYCEIIKLKEYPLLTSLYISRSEITYSKRVTGWCPYIHENLIKFETNDKEKIQQYIKLYYNMIVREKMEVREVTTI